MYSKSIIQDPTPVIIQHETVSSEHSSTLESNICNRQLALHLSSMQVLHCLLHEAATPPIDIRTVC